jgi:hypothetical protein
MSESVKCIIFLDLNDVSEECSTFVFRIDGSHFRLLSASLFSDLPFGLKIETMRFFEMSVELYRAKYR